MGYALSYPHPLYSLGKDILPLLDAGRHFDLGHASPSSSSELDRERAMRMVVHTLLGAGARPLLLPAIYLGLRLDGGGCRSARSYGQWRTGSSASPVRPQGHRAGGGLERCRRGLLPSSSPRPAVPTRPSFLDLFLPIGIGFGELPVWQNLCIPIWLF
jgi:hypothetical protein